MGAGPFAERGHLRSPERPQQVLDELHLLARDHELAAVGRVVDAVEGRSAGRALLLHVGRLVLGEGRADHVGAGGHQRFVHRDVDIVAATGVLAAQQRHQDARETMETTDEIGDGDAGDRRPSVVAQGQAQHAGHGLQREIVRGAAGIGAVLAEGADRAIDDARVLRGDRLVADAEARGDTGAERFDQHVGFAGETEEIGPALLALEVEHDALLAAAHVAEEYRGARVGRQDVTAGIALAGRLDLDHLGAVIGQRGGEIRSRQEPGEIDDLDALKLHDDLPNTESLSAPSGEHADCTSRSPSMRRGLARTRRSPFTGCGTDETMPVSRAKELSSAWSRR